MKKFIGYLIAITIIAAAILFLAAFTIVGTYLLDIELPFLDSLKLLALNFVGLYFTIWGLLEAMDWAERYLSKNERERLKK